jgi:hypothetical protein
VHGSLWRILGRDGPTVEHREVQIIPFAAARTETMVTAYRRSKWSLWVIRYRGIRPPRQPMSAMRLIAAKFRDAAK